MFDPLNRQRGIRSEFRFLLISAVALAGLYLAFVYPHTHDFSISRADCETLNGYWDQQLQKDFKLAEGWKSSVPFACPSPRAHLARAVRFLAMLEAKIDGRHPQTTYHQWAKDLQPAISTTPLFGLAGRTLFESRTVQLSPIILDKGNWVQIAGVLVHELRHLEQGRNTHVPCQWEARMACDARFDLDPQSADAYSYGMLFLHKVRQSARTSRYEKRLARHEMQQMLDKRFNLIDPSAYLLLDLDPPGN